MWRKDWGLETWSATVMWKTIDDLNPKRFFITYPQDIGIEVRMEIARHSEKECTYEDQELQLQLL